MNYVKVAKTLGQITPGNACLIVVEHGIDEQAVVRSGPADMTGPARQQMFNPFALRTRECILTCHVLIRMPWRKSSCQRLVWVSAVAEVNSVLDEATGMS